MPQIGSVAIRLFEPAVWIAHNRTLIPGARGARQAQAGSQGRGHSPAQPPKVHWVSDWPCSQYRWV